MTTETNENANSGILELEKIFKEYKDKLEHAERESSEVVNLAWKKAEKIIAEGQEKAGLIAAEIEQKAREEASRIVLQAENRAAQISKEIDEKVKKEAKDRTRREIEKILAETRQTAEKESAEAVARSKKEARQLVDELVETSKAQAQKEASIIVTGAQETAKKINEESIAGAAETSKLLAETLQKAEGLFDQCKTRLQSEFTGLLLDVARAKEGLANRIVAKSAAAESNKANNGSVPLEGRRELLITPPYDGAQIKRLKDFLRQMPGIKIAGEAADDEHVSIYVEIGEPLPLLALLRETSLITSSDVVKDAIRLKLKPSRNGN